MHLLQICGIHLLTFEEKTIVTLKEEASPGNSSSQVLTGDLQNISIGGAFIQLEESIDAALYKDKKWEIQLTFLTPEITVLGVIVSN